MQNNWKKELIEQLEEIAVQDILVGATIAVGCGETTDEELKEKQSKVMATFMVLGLFVAMKKPDLIPFLQGDDDPASPATEGKVEENSDEIPFGETPIASGTVTGRMSGVDRS
jgi:hypothetical protein